MEKNQKITTAMTATAHTGSVGHRKGVSDAPIRSKIARATQRPRFIPSKAPATANPTMARARRPKSGDMASRIDNRHSTS